MANLSAPIQPYMQFLFIGPGLCLWLPSDSTSRWTPLPLANGSHCQAIADFHRQAIAHAGRTTKSGTDDINIVGPTWNVSRQMWLPSMKIARAHVSPIFNKHYVNSFDKSSNRITLFEVGLVHRFPRHHGRDFGVAHSHGNLGHDTVSFDFSNVSLHPISYSGFYLYHLLTPILKLPKSNTYYACQISKSKTRAVIKLVPICKIV